MSLWQKCTIALLGVTIFGGLAWFARIAFRPPELERYQSIPWVSYVHPNVKKLNKAQALVREGKLSEARALLVNALITAPRSPVTQELRDLLGEINTRMFFSKEPSPRKIEYVVKRGDALASIARRLGSSPAAIIRVNNLDSTLIRPGEKLLVPRLDFGITIDLPHKRLVVHDSRGFFTQYPIASADLPPSRQAAMETKVTAKSFWKNGRPVRLNDGVQQQAAPRIDLSHSGYVLYGVGKDRYASTSEIAVTPGDEEEPLDFPKAHRQFQGIAMLDDDLAEVQFLVRKGTPVTIIFNGEQTPNKVH